MENRNFRLEREMLLAYAFRDRSQGGFKQITYGDGLSEDSVLRQLMRSQLAGFDNTEEWRKFLGVYWQM